jgi:hypothetical protein
MKMSGQLHTPAALHSETNTPPPLTGANSVQAGRAPEPVWSILEQKNLLSVPGIKPRFLRHPTRSSVTTMTELSLKHNQGFDI